MGYELAGNRAPCWGCALIRLTGHERVQTERNGPLRRLAALERLDVLRAANLLRDSDPAMNRALMAWQYLLLRRAMAAPGGDGGPKHAA